MHVYEQMNNLRNIFRKKTLEKVSRDCCDFK